MWAHLRARHPLENDQAMAAQKEQGRKKAEAEERAGLGYILLGGYGHHVHR